MVKKSITNQKIISNHKDSRSKRSNHLYNL
nr:MAG TPA: hypothetical protein [Caudoviricetes sp.]